MTGKEELFFTEDAIFIKETRLEAVMHNSEIELMSLLANIVTTNGGDILEIGFGMHLSADEIQKNQNVKSHTIIEIHPEIYKRALLWSYDKPNVRIILGDWHDILHSLDMKFDGVLHDTHRDHNIKKFLELCKPICKKNCIVGFFSYPYFEESLNQIQFTLKDEHYSRLPYKGVKTFNLKYTIFDGQKFCQALPPGFEPGT